MTTNFDKNKRLCFPDGAIYILSALEKSGFSAFAVGGCVRDSLLGRIPDDWDFATSALPGQIMEIFGSSAIPTGIKHGTVTVRHGNFSAEVTTFRTDGTYSDHRRPDSVHFVSDIQGDLARRDFTMNAIAAPISGSLIDPFGGQGDISRRLIRCVGKPEERFSEDALRMLRAVRFSSKLGFEIEAETFSAILSLSGLSASLASERVAAELEKIIIGSVTAIQLLFSSGLMRDFLLSEANPDFSPLSTLPPERLARLSGLCAILQREKLADSEVFLKKLRLDSFTVKNVSSGVRAALCGLPESPYDWKRLLYRLGVSACQCACFAASALGRRDGLEAFSAVITSGDCLSLSQLAVGGKDLMALGYSGRELGSRLEELLLHVFAHPEDNNRKLLISLLKSKHSAVDDAAQ